jgi:hydrogenase assembly chaperone HypC/HupF
MFADMCIAIPLKVLTIKSSYAVMNDGRKVQTGMVGKVKKGDWLLVKANLALNVISENEAGKINNAIKEINEQIS